MNQSLGLHCQTCIVVVEAASPLWKLHCPSRRGQGWVIECVSPLWLHCCCGSCIAIIVCYASAVNSLSPLSSSCCPRSSWSSFPLSLCSFPPHHSSWSCASCPSSAPLHLVPPSPPPGLASFAPHCLGPLLLFLLVPPSLFSPSPQFPPACTAGIPGLEYPLPVHGWRGADWGMTYHFWHSCHCPPWGLCCCHCWGTMYHCWHSCCCPPWGLCCHHHWHFH